MRTIVSSFFFLFLPLLAAAEQPDDFLASPNPPSDDLLLELSASETRTLVSLDGAWEYSDDGEDWVAVTIPSSYLAADRFYLRRTFTIPSSLVGTRVWELTGYGVQYSGSIKINDAFIVQREGLIPFRAPVPEELELKETNAIVIEIDNRLDFSRTLPGRRMPLDVRTYGGVVRSLFLVGTPRIRIDDVRIDRSAGGAPRFEVDVISGSIKGMPLQRNAGDTTALRRITSDEANLSLSIALLGSPIDDTTEARRTGEISQEFSLASRRTETIGMSMDGTTLSRWSPGSAGLSRVVIDVRYNGVLVDRRTMKVGGRRLRADGKRLVLGDSSFALKGVVYIEDSEEFGASLSFEQMRADVEAIAGLGANSIRFCGGVPHPYLLSLCDEFGLLAFVDLPIGSFPASFFREDEVIERAIDRARATVAATRDYTCVVGYGVGFPAPLDADASLRMLGELRAVVAEGANDRLFYAVASNWEGAGELLDLVDMVGITQLDGSIEQLSRLVSNTLTAVGEKRPVVSFGFGRLVRLGNESGYADETSTQAQAKFIGDAISLFERTELAGYFYWSWSDYRTDRPLLTIDNENQYIATSGLVTLGQEMRIAGKTLAAFYTDQKSPDLAIGEYSPPSTILFIGVGILCAILFLFLINGSRRFRENVFRAFLRPYNFYSDIRDQRILSTLQTSVLALVIAATVAVIVASLFYFYRMDESFDFVLSAVVSADGLKETLNYLIWRPILAVLVFTILFFSLLLLIAGLVRLCSFFVRNRIFFGDAYAIAVWGALPVLLLIPVAMVLYRLLELPGAGPVAFTIVMLVALWILYRVLRGTAVIFDVPAPRVYMYGVGSVVALLIILFFTSGNVAAMVNYLFEGVGTLYGRG